MNEKVNNINNNLVLEVDGLSTQFIYKNRIAKAVRDVSFKLEKGKCLNDPEAVSYVGVGYQEEGYEEYTRIYYAPRGGF